MDIVYPLWSPSKHHNKELRYSIRSAWKHGKNLGKLWIVGMPIRFLHSRHIIPYDPSYRCKDVNIFGAALQACENPDVSDPFLLFNDDYFMLREFDANAIPAWYGDVPLFQQKRSQKIFRKTLMFLGARGIKEPKFFDVHMPIPIHKACLLHSRPNDWQKRKFLSKMTYANQCPELNPVKTLDCKIGIHCDLQAAKERFMFSTSDYPAPDVWEYLEQQFPDPSPFEGKR